ncbi:MAG: adenylate/guanylate cyclase domain-containing protein [Lysobacter sp.]|nr:adenylate/guanylate cyclase domain-containing protein [Lysobacter sp.]
MIPVDMSEHRPDESEATPAQAVAAAERSLHRGEPLLAYNAAQSGLERWPGHVRLRQLQALALARSGDGERANRLLGALAGEGHADAETLGMLARTHKDLALAARDGARRAAHLQAGFGLYARAFESACREGSDADAWYAGINAAAMAALKGDLEAARRLAGEVRGICLREARGEDETSRYWREATLGEASLILGDGDAAAAHYARASVLAGGRAGDRGSTRRQAMLLAAHLPGASAAVAEVLRVAPVLVFTGNMIDQPGRAAARFPAAIEPAVREAVRQRVEGIRPAAAYGSAACGADLLCLEAVRELGGETHVVLPFPPAEFRRASVDFATGDWGERFERALAEADSVTVASDHRASGSAATFEYANLILTGMGRLRAGVLDAELRALAVWDPEVAGAAGGAASLVSLWERRGIAIEHVRLRARQGAGEAVAAPAEPACAEAAAHPAARHEMRAMLFADAVGYSQLSEDQVPRYIAGFLGAVAELSRRTAHPLEHVETSGDGLYMVFGGVADAGHFALELNALANGFDRAAHGLPPNFNLRIALHCGPVHCGRDPITGRPLYTGPHTSRTARIEPITPPGQVYASSAFAAVAAASGADGLAMGYVGRIPLAKGYGTLGLYHVRPAD